MTTVTSLTPHETVEFLLVHYVDVVNGIYDAPRSHEGPVLMCRAWNHPAYQQLERLRQRLRAEQPKLHWHLAETYFRPITRRTAYCPRCPIGHQHYPPNIIGHVHTHGRKTIALVPRIQKIISPLVRAELVTDGVTWLVDHWHGEPDIPDDLRPLAGLEEPEKARVA